MSRQLHDTIRSSFRRLLKPVIRFSLSRSIRIQEFEAIAKSVFLEAAEEELSRQGHDLTVSKLSAMTGIQRREVTRLWRDQEEPTTNTDLITRLLGQWQGDKRFVHPSGQPKILSFHGREGKFVSLVDSVSTDLSPYTVLAELERTGLAVNTDEGVKLLKQSYRPVGDLRETLGLLTSDVSDLVRAVDENSFSDPKQPNLHMTTSYDNIPASRMLEVRKWFLEQGMHFHDEARKFLSRLDRDVSRNSRDTEEDGSDKPTRIRAAISTFSLTEDISSMPHKSGASRGVGQRAKTGARKK